MPKTVTVTLDGAMLHRGFWLYVWEINDARRREGSVRRANWG